MADESAVLIKEKLLPAAPMGYVATDFKGAGSAVGGVVPPPVFPAGFFLHEQTKIKINTNPESSCFIIPFSFFRTMVVNLFKPVLNFTYNRQLQTGIIPMH